MKKFLTSIVAVVAFAAGVFFTTAFTNSPKQNSGPAAHPRIAKAIAQMQDAIAYLNSAPDVFQGHKAVAIAKTNAAIRELKICESYPVR